MIARHSGAVNVRRTVLYNNTEGLGLYRKIGAMFILEEDPRLGRDADYDTVVLPRPTDVDALR